MRPRLAGSLIGAEDVEWATRAKTAAPVELAAFAADWRAMTLAGNRLQRRTPASESAHVAGEAVVRGLSEGILGFTIREKWRP